MKRTILTMLLLAAVIGISAQEDDDQHDGPTISGHITDVDAKEPIEQATIQMFRVKDSTFVGGTLSDVRGSWLLVYVGIAAAAISAPAFSAETVGRILLIPAALGAVVLLPLVYRADYLAPIPQPQRPLFCITAAPVSIWLVGYLSVAPQPSEPLVLGLLILSQLLYIPALFRFFQTFRDLFAPSFASFSFPFVIVTTACKRAAAFLTVTASLRLLIQVEIASALVFCCFTVWKYCRFLFAREKAAL